MSSQASISPDKTDVGHDISFGEAFRVWLRVALLSFGGPAGQMAGQMRGMMHPGRGKELGA